MCGILGSVNIPFDHEVLNQLAHRGPDDFGINNFNVGDNSITFGHRRLSIVDLSSAGHQPMISHCGNYVIIFNGEIYNHLNLRDKLQDILFSGHSDTETIVNYIAKYGISSIKDFNGIFGFALYDKLANKIYIARDRFGVKPLYYYQESNRFIFSSELKPIRNLIDWNLDEESLALLLRLRYCPAPYTLIRNVYKLRPGHIACFDLSTKSLSISSFLSYEYKESNLKFTDALERYGFLFEQAVERQLMADVDVGMLLSGGVDSALVAHFAVKHYQRVLKTFTVGFKENTDANELSQARATSKMLGTEHHEVVISDVQFDESFRKLVLTIEEPLGTTSTIPLYYLNELASKHVKVVLSGQGADEPLGGYARYQGELYRELLPNVFWSAISNYGSKIFKKNEKIQRALYALPLNDTVRRFDNTYALYKYEEIDALTGIRTDRPYDLIAYFFELLNGKGRHPVSAIMSNDLRMNLSDDLLLLADKISMHFSMEGRVPLLDNELIDFIENLPYSFKVGYGKGKIIHKKFAEQHLPVEIVRQKKKGFKTPTDKWFREKLGSKYRELLTSKQTKFNTFFDTNAVNCVFNKHNDGVNQERQIFTLIGIYYWLEDFL